MKNHSLVAGIILVLLLAPSSIAEVRYSITELPLPPGAIWAEPTGINDQGQVAGFAYYPSQTMRPLIWEQGVPKFIVGGENWYSGYAGGINARGHVAVGWWDGQSRSSLVLATPGGEQVLGRQQATGQVYALNDNDHAVGFIADDVAAITRAVMWRNGSMINLGVSGDMGTVAHDIDNTDRIVGVRVAGRIGRPFRWHHGLLAWLQPLDPERHAAAVALNNLGHAVGVSITSEGTARAVLWSDTRALDLGMLSGGRFSNAWDINDAGQIVGRSSGDEGSAAALWEDGHVYDLNGLVGAGSSWRMSVANRINNRGQIVGSGDFEGRGAVFLLTPIPEPGWGLVVLSLTVVTVRRRCPRR